MKITIVVGAFLPVPTLRGGAIEKAWFALGQEFAARGHEVAVISRAFPELASRETLHGVDHVRVAGFDTPSSLSVLKFFDLIYSLRVRRVLPRADVLVTNTFWLPMVVRDPGFGRQYIHVGRYPKGQLRFYTRASRWQAPSTAIADAIREQVPAEQAKVTTIPYPIDRATDPPPLEIREKVIVYAGRIHPEKGVHLLVEAFASAPRLEEWRLHLVGPHETSAGGGGDHYRSELQLLAQPAATRIEFTGGKFGAGALEGELRRGRVFVYPSLAERGETFGLAALEAMAQGCAVLVSDLACFRDFVREAETGFIFDHRQDPVARLRTKLVSLCVDRAELGRVAENGYREAARFSLSKVADAFLADFERVLTET